MQNRNLTWHGVQPYDSPFLLIPRFSRKRARGGKLGSSSSTLNLIAAPETETSTRVLTNPGYTLHVVLDHQSLREETTY